jgi:peptidoglycan/xylan/chitin deacetylase (PgdA/CDA1 family)
MTESLGRISRRTLFAVGGLAFLSACGTSVAGGRTSGLGKKGDQAGPGIPGQRATSPATPPAGAKPTSGTNTGTEPAEPTNFPTQPEYYVHNGPNAIALTIDDGPSRTYTPQVLAVLAQYNVKVTFCMVGSNVGYDTGIVNEVVQAGHHIANHTWTHADLTTKPLATVRDELHRTSDAIHQASGFVPQLFRAPYGAWNRNVYLTCAENKLRPLDWSVDPRDWARPGVDAIVRNIRTHVRPGRIILDHDGGGDRRQTVAALRIWLPELLSQGYQFTMP